MSLLKGHSTEAIELLAIIANNLFLLDVVTFRANISSYKMST